MCNEARGGPARLLPCSAHDGERLRIQCGCLGTRSGWAGVKLHGEQTVPFLHPALHRRKDLIEHVQHGVVIGHHQCREAALLALVFFGNG